ncbi:cytochrome P450 family protein [Mycolicibacterium arenosum]|uniref:Cytochrome P450 n=1 Tax=Mycolicibacterium arenosum TaxID=2952157 RepID=A0ABT1LVI2_9MYCO|nr:cytochrome P450 [Mycolicibacterium sp. CAU 1645]MCP9270906.1 cytochrome P450 [Mycolicibacterium sp. CAU 1645]
MTPPAALDRIDVTSSAFRANPFPYYARMRAEAPVLRVDAGRFGPAWLITRYDDVAAALVDDRLVKDRRNAVPPEQARTVRNMPRFLASLERGLLSLDGDEHDRLRGLARRAFTPRRIEHLSDQILTRADDLLDTAADRGGMDVVSDFALPLATALIAGILGVPEHDTPRFSRWSTALIHGPQRRFPATAVPSILRFLGYVRRLIEDKAQNPRDDLISAMVSVREGDDRLTADEILAMVVLLLTAGHETTVNLIASGTLALLDHPAQLARWRADATVAGTGVEELARFVVPAETATQRYAREDISIGGARIPQGSLVLAVLASANRDHARFESPDQLDIGRVENRHLSFGRGAHYCLGAPLARMEARIAITALLHRAPGLTLAVNPEKLEWRGGLVLRGLRSLPVAFG